MSGVEDKRRALKRNRAFATSLLAGAAVVFVATRLVPEPGFALRLIGTAAEAAIIGGLADWFAVTALFRRPLGLPIPHTALIPSRKDEIADSFGLFIRDQFLVPELLTERLRRANRAHEIAEWLDRAETANLLAQRLAGVLPTLLESADDSEVQGFIGRIVGEGLRRADIIASLDAFLGRYIEAGRHMDIVDVAAATVAPSLRALKAPIIEKIGEQTGRFFPSYFDRKVGRSLIDGAEGWLAAVRAQDSEERARLDGWIRARFAEFRASPDYGGLLEDIRRTLLSNPDVLRSLASTWNQIKQELLQDAASPTPKAAILISELVRAAGRFLKNSPSMQTYVNQGIEKMVVGTIAPWRAQIATYVTDVVKGWDGPQVAETIELQVGSDLQFIRINGTVVGALIGSLLFLIGAGFPLLLP
jgi:uncharacterized membrane-anchored protein YjiN (DUF445 family)